MYQPTVRRMIQVYSKRGENMDLTIFIISILLTLIVGVVVAYFIFKSVAQAKITGAQGSAEQILEKAKEKRNL